MIRPFLYGEGGIPTPFPGTVAACFGIMPVVLVEVGFHFKGIEAVCQHGVPVQAGQGLQPIP